MIEELNDIRSSHVQSVQYNHGTRELSVGFKSGDRYRYDGVSHQHWRNMKDATSVGGYLKRLIIPQHAATKLPKEQ